MSTFEQFLAERDMTGESFAHMNRRDRDAVLQIWQRESREQEAADAQEAERAGESFREWDARVRRLHTPEFMQGLRARYEYEHEERHVDGPLAIHVSGESETLRAFPASPAHLSLRGEGGDGRNGQGGNSALAAGCLIVLALTGGFVLLCLWLTK